MLQQREAARDIPLPVQVGTERLTPVFGTAQPATGGPATALRRAAYARPAHDPRRWLLLLAADRVEIGGNLARETITPGQQSNVARHYARQARAHPRNALIAAGALASALLLKLRPRRHARR